MSRGWLAATALVGLCLAGASPSAGTAAQELTKPQAVAAVRALLRVKAPACGLQVVRITATRSATAWRVSATTSGRAAGVSRWSVVRKPAPLNPLARRIVAGCPAAPPPRDPVVPPTPAPAPGAPATYVFGSQLSATQQALVRRGLDAGARLYRSSLGRELPALTVWANTNLDELVAAYAANVPASPENARALWLGGQVGHATLRQVWLGPPWFVSGPDSNQLKIAAHEAFHLLQYEVMGMPAMSVSGLDVVARAGPWWLLEGSAEYFAYLAVVADGAVSLAEVRARWIRAASGSAKTLVDLATLRGQRETSGAYDIYALATEALLRGRDPKLVFAYFEAIARGVEWHEAFATSFGRAFEAFVAEFEAYRRAV